MRICAASPPCLTAVLLFSIAAQTCARVPLGAREPDLDAYRQIGLLLSESASDRKGAAEALRADGGEDLIPGIVDTLFFIPRQHRTPALRVLRTLSGENPGERYHDWVEWVGRRVDLEPRPGYLDLKRALLARIDPDYRKIFFPSAPSRIRPQEIVWGGVKVDGIPPLEEPAQVPAAEAGYLEDSERVFGVSLGGEARAYPLRFLGWHEMLNDVVGGRHVTLSYCTLCGSGILYETETPNGSFYTFGTSGLLYRSNKLMYDRQTWSLWSNLTGEPVFGRLASSSARLEPLPMTLTTWEDWLETHPETTVLAFDDEMRAAARHYGYRYRPGASDRAREGVSFPVWQESDALDAREEIYALRIDGAAKAYPLDLLLERGVVNDRVGTAAVVLIADPESGAVRAYRRGEHTFRRSPSASALQDEEGTEWIPADERLVARSDGAAEASRELERIPGHVAFWFGWYGFYPDTEIYRPGDEAEP